MAKAKPAESSKLKAKSEDKTKKVKATTKKSSEKKLVTNKKEAKNGTDKKSDTAAVQADSKRKEVGQKVQSPKSKVQSKENAEKAGSEQLAENSEEEKTAASATPLAKAGKHSAKALKEAEEKQAKEQRKAESSKLKEEDEQKPKIQQKPSRSKLERKGKNFRKAAELIEKDKLYNINEATELAAKTSPVKFDATVEMHIRLGVDPKQADQNVRDMVVLPAGTGKSIRIAVYADADGVAAAKKAGADIAASDEFLQQLDKGTLNFDSLIATPAMMPKLGKYARLLGPKGLMPNPKSGTVTTDITKAVTEAKAGRVEYRVDSTGIVHLGIGKVSFGGNKLAENAKAVLASIKSNKPSSLKGNYMRSIHITTSMGPSIPVELGEAN